HTRFSRDWSSDVCSSDLSADTRGFTTAQLLADHLGHLVLPTLTLMLTGYAAWSRYQRTSMLEVLNSDYVRLARAKGLPNRVVLRPEERRVGKARRRRLQR